MHKEWFRGLFVVFLLLTASCFSRINAAETRTITDMDGRTVPMPAEIHKILVTSHHTTDAVYMLDPDVW